MASTSRTKASLHAAEKIWLTPGPATLHLSKPCGHTCRRCWWRERCGGGRRVGFPCGFPRELRWQRTLSASPQHPPGLPRLQEGYFQLSCWQHPVHMDWDQDGVRMTAPFHAASCVNSSVLARLLPARQASSSLIGIDIHRWRVKNSNHLQQRCHSRLHPHEPRIQTIFGGWKEGRRPLDQLQPQPPGAAGAHHCCRWAACWG